MGLAERLLMDLTLALIKVTWLYPLVARFTLEPRQVLDVKMVSVVLLAIPEDARTS